MELPMDMKKNLRQIIFRKPNRTFIRRTWDIYNTFIILHLLQLDLHSPKLELHYKAWWPLYVPKPFRIKHNQGLRVHNRGPFCWSEYDHHVSWPMMNPIKKNASPNIESFQPDSIKQKQVSELFFSRISFNLKYLSCTNRSVNHFVAFSLDILHK